MGDIVPKLIRDRPIFHIDAAVFQSYNSSRRVQELILKDSFNKDILGKYICSSADLNVTETIYITFSKLCHVCTVPSEL